MGGRWVEVAPGVRVHRPVATAARMDATDALIRDLERRALTRGPITAGEVVAVLAAVVLLALALWPLLEALA